MRIRKPYRNNAILLKLYFNYRRWGCNKMTERCCLCSSDVLTGTMKINRRKVNGEASKLALDVINNLAVFISDDTQYCWS